MQPRLCFPNTNQNFTAWAKLLDNFALLSFLSNININDYKLSKVLCKAKYFSPVLSNEPHATALFHVSVNLILKMVPSNMQIIW
jgi:hypothetical protein